MCFMCVLLAVFVLLVRCTERISHVVRMSVCVRMPVCVPMSICVRMSICVLLVLCTERMSHAVCIPLVGVGLDRAVCIHRV